MRVRLNLVEDPRQAEEGGGLQGGLPPLDPQGMNEVEPVSEREVAQP